MLADRSLVAFAPEIAGERLLANDMLASSHCIYDHGGVQIRRRADVDNVEFPVGDQVGKASVRPRYPVPGRKRDNMLSPRSDCPDFDVDAVDTPISGHVKLRNKAAPDQTDLDFRHCGYLWVALGESSRLQTLQDRKSV